MKATSIVDGIQQQSNGDVDVVHLNLLGRTGREIGAAYGVKIVPATVMIGQDGEVIGRQNGFPDAERIRQALASTLIQQS